MIHFVVVILTTRETRAEIGLTKLSILPLKFYCKGDEDFFFFFSSAMVHAPMLEYFPFSLCHIPEKFSHDNTSV